MLLDERVRASGGALFRWRSHAPIVFLPLLVLAVREAEPVQRAIGERWGDLFEGGCSLLSRPDSRCAAAVPPGRWLLNATGLYSLTRLLRIPGC